MLDDLWRDLGTWWAGLSPEFVFLLALPFFVAGVALAGEAVRSRRRARRVGAGSADAALPTRPVALRPIPPPR